MREKLVHAVVVAGAIGLSMLFVKAWSHVEEPLAIPFKVRAVGLAVCADGVVVRNQ